MSDFRPDEKNVVYIGEGVSMTGSVQAQDSLSLTAMSMARSLAAN